MLIKAKSNRDANQRAKENTSDYAILFEEYMKDIAEVMFMFAKFYYDKRVNIIEHGVKATLTLSLWTKMRLVVVIMYLMM